ncbi:MAG: hypothetical protein EOO89_00035 [Pedobacter sp.]|nr:MAG: hypothetical protein EOO89_00035 [Pedobacter sp.]
MKKFNFIRKTVNLATLTAHPLLIEWGFDFKPDEHFAGLLKLYGLYEIPVVDPKGKIITHVADVLAAIENGETHIDVYEIDMDDIDLKLFIFLKHKYSQKSQVKSYHAAKFFRNYLENNDDGKRLAGTLPGDINKKVGQLMQTSDSTIKRLLSVGDSNPAYLGMIDEKNLSFHDAESKIKVDRHTKKHKEKLHQVNNKPEEINNEINDSTSFKTVIELPINTFHVGNEIVTYGFEGKDAFINIGGKRLTNIIHEEHVNTNSDNCVTVSHIFQEKKPNGRSIQISFENFSKAA